MALNFSSLSGGTSFTIVTSTGGTKTATLDKAYPAGTYLIESKAMDTNLEVYLGASDGTQVGTAAAGAKTVTASASFLYVTTVNADANDAVVFTLKSASTLATKTDAVWAPPTITDITPSGLPNTNDTTTITGTNFATNVDVKFRKSDDATLVNAKTTVRGSATSIIASRPDTFSPTDAPYDVIVTNPSTGLAATSLNSITAGAVPVWVTSTTLNGAIIDSAFSQTISATDADGGSSITYAIVSGSLHTGLSLNTSTGAITGTPTGSSSTDTVTISATDSGGNTVNRTFTQLVAPGTISFDVLLIGGGGGGGALGGGGAGGFRYLSGQSLPSNSSFAILIGAGGSGRSGSTGSGVSAVYPVNGTYSSMTNSSLSITASGGGAGSDETNPGSFTGGSGGGGVLYGAAGNLGGYTPVEGYAGGSGQSASTMSGGGGGGAGAIGSNGTTSSGGTGGSGTNTYSSWVTAITSSMSGVSGWSTSTSSGYITGGGGGGAYNGPTNGTGGSGGGGRGGSSSVDSTSGTPNTGGGGGAMGYTGSGWLKASGSTSGASGFCVVRYAGAQIANGGNQIVTTGGYTYHIFTSSGSLNNQTVSAKATGGNISYDSTYVYHTFLSNGTFTPSQNITADYLVVGAGGAGGGNGRGGGAGGEVKLVSSSSLTNGSNYSVTVGTGAYWSGNNLRNGGSSIFNGTTSLAGQDAGDPTGGVGQNGGASGGNYPGNIGGTGTTTYSSWGKATGAGHNVSGTYYFAGGGGGGGQAGGAVGGAGGSGGGGKGGTAVTGYRSGTDGLPNTGGGGGAASDQSTDVGLTGRGGSGVVIIRYAR